MKSLYFGVLVAVGVGCAHQPGGPGGTAALAPVSPLQAAESAKKAHQEAQTFVVSLSAAVRDQPRDENWAGPKEKQLRQTFASSPAAQLGVQFRELTCKSSLCELVLQTKSSTSAGSVPPLTVVDQWLAWEQACGYTLSVQTGEGPAAPEILRAFLHCAK